MAVTSCDPLSDGRCQRSRSQNGDIRKIARVLGEQARQIQFVSGLDAKSPKVGLRKEVLWSDG